MFKYNSRTFNEMYESFDEFKQDLDKFGYDFSRFEESDLKLTFVFLTARYGDSEIIGYSNEYRWKMRLQYIMFTYGQEWAIKRKIQNQVLDLKEEDLQRSGVQISNVTENPATLPTNTTVEELDYINKQVTNATKRDKLSILILKYGALSSSANDEYMDKFKLLFSRYVSGDLPKYSYKSKYKGDEYD